jgi:hypothetical protein
LAVNIKSESAGKATEIEFVGVTRIKRGGDGFCIPQFTIASQFTPDAEWVTAACFIVNRYASSVLKHVDVQYWARAACIIHGWVGFGVHQELTGVAGRFFRGACNVGQALGALVADVILGSIDVVTLGPA